MEISRKSALLAHKLSRLKTTLPHMEKKTIVLYVAWNVLYTVSHTYTYALYARLQ